MAVASGMFPIPVNGGLIDSDKANRSEESARSEESLENQQEMLENQKTIGQQTVAFLKRMFSLENEKSIPNGLLKFRDKLLRFEYKAIVQNKYYQASLKALNAIKNSIGQGLIDLIIGLLAFALFDPDGSLLSSLVMLFANLLVMIIGMIGQLLPKIIGILITVIPVLITAIKNVLLEVAKLMPVIIDTIIALIPVIFDALTQIIPALIQGIGTIIVTILGKLGEYFPALQGVVDLLITAIQSIVSWVNPQTVGILLKWAAIIGGIIAAIVVVVKVVTFIISVLKILGLVIGFLFSPIGLIIAAVVGLIAVIYLLWANWDTVSKWLAEAWEWMKNAAIAAVNWIVDALMSLWDTAKKVIIGVLAVMFLPVTMMVLVGMLIYNHWETIKGFIFSIIGMVMKILNKFKKILFKTIDGVLNIVSSKISSVVNIFRGMMDKIRSMFDPENIFQSIKTAVSNAFENIPGLAKIRQFFDDLMEKLKNSAIGRFLSGGDKPTENAVSYLFDAATVGYNIDFNKDAALLFEAMKSKNRLTPAEVAKVLPGTTSDQANKLIAPIEELADAVEAIAKEKGVDIKSGEDLKKFLEGLDIKESNAQLLNAIKKLAQNTSSAGNQAYTETAKRLGVTP